MTIVKESPSAPCEQKLRPSHEGGDDGIFNVMAAFAMDPKTPSDAEPSTFDSLPPELIVNVLASCDSAYDIGRAACTCHAFDAKHVELALRMRAGLCGERDEPLPDGEVSWTQLMCWWERRVQQQRGTILAAGQMHSAFVDAKGRLLTCGSDADGRGLLGHSVDKRNVPVPTVLPACCNLGGSMVGERVVAVAAHTMHTLALTADGSVYSFGHGGCGKLGHGSEELERQPRRIEAFSQADEVIVSIAAGRQHNLALTREGRVYSWGSGFGGKLGHGDRRDTSVPRPVDALAETRVTAVACGSCHSLAVDADGAVWSFGHGVMGQLGHGDRNEQLAPKRIAALASVRCVGAAGGENHSLVHDDAGGCFSFGAGSDGRLGHGHDVGHGVLEELLLPQRIVALRGLRVLSVAAGREHSVVLVDGGAVWTFGAGGSGKLGHGDARYQWLPTRVAGLRNRRVVAVAAGDSHSLAALADGTVLGWGSGGLGVGLTHFTDPSTTVDHPPTAQQLGPTMAQQPTGSAGNQFFPPASLTPATSVPTPLKHRVETTRDVLSGACGCWVEEDWAWPPWEQRW